MATVSYKLGFENKLYIGPASQIPTREFKDISEATLTLTSAEVDVTSRRNAPYKTYASGMLDASLAVTADVASGDNLANTIQEAWAGRSAIAVKVEIGNGKSFISDMVVTECSVAQPLEEALRFSFTLKPTIADDEFLTRIEEDAE